MSSRTVGENAAILGVIVVLILGGATILSVPYGVRQAPASTSQAPAVTPTTVVTSTNGTSVSDATSPAPGALTSFQTYSQLRDFVTSNAKSFQPTGYPGAVFRTTTIVAGTVTGMISASTATMTVTGTTTMMEAPSAAQTNTLSSTTGSPSYTKTNNQVQGVDELDIVKTDGTYLYVATSQTVSIVRAYPVNESGVVSKINLPDYHVVGMSLGSQRLAVLAQSLVNSSVNLRLYDVSSPGSPTLLNSIGISGQFVGARMAGGYFYLVVQQPSFTSSGGGNVTAAYPTMREDGVSAVVSPGSTYYTPNTSQVSVYTMVMAMSMSTGQEGTVAVLTGPTSTIYVSASNIYVVYSNFYPRYADGIAGDVYNGGSFQTGTAVLGQNSTIFRVAYSGGNITVAAAGSFPGAVLNQYSMNEYDGYFMVATSHSGIDDVYVLDQSFGQVGALHNIAPGENIYSVRFEGDIGYVVTFEQVDPLFTISFANPADPVVLSALHINGFSDYLHPFDTNYLIGVGKDTVNSSNGNFAYYLGLKVSLFNVTTGKSTVVDNYIIGARGTDSPVLSNALAFTFDSATDTMVIPVELYTASGGQTVTCSGCPPPFGQYTWQGAYVFRVSDTGFNLLGTVTQNTAGQSPSTHVVDRTVIIGDVLYTISQNEVMATSLSSFATLVTIPIG